MKKVAVAIVAATLLAGCGSSTPDATPLSKACSAALGPVNDASSAVVAAVKSGQMPDGQKLLGELGDATKAAQGVSPLDADLKTFQVDVVAALAADKGAADVASVAKDRSVLVKDCSWSTTGS